jgi:ABC-type Fe3+/spermidine/putrescine transport system ATPase subunit
MTLLKLLNLSKRYTQPAVRDVSLTLNRGSILCLLGPSGCGKTTLLRLVAGLEIPDSGSVFFDGVDVTEQPTHRRQFGMMFQELALFPHKSVFENIAFGLGLLKQTPSQIRQRTEEMLSLVGMSEMALRNVADLSGGERQRVALARSLAPRPKLLMLDEPLGALDRALRERLLLEIRSILKQLHVTAIFVTHDQTEALTVADVIAVMDHGRLIQIDPPEKLYRHPRYLFVARFLGFQNLLPGTVTSAGDIRSRLGIFNPSAHDLKPGESVTLVLRPESALLTVAKDARNRLQKIEGKLLNRRFSGQTYRIKMAVDTDLTLTFDLPNMDPPPAVGESITVWLNPEHIITIKS